MKYYISKKLNTSFEQAVIKVKEALLTEGFGVLSEIDLHEKLKEKLNVDFRKYKILGACNPSYAYKAILYEDKIGTMLPCNVIVQQHGDGRVEISAIDPVASMQAIGNSALADIAGKVRDRLQQVVEEIGPDATDRAG